MTVILTPDQDDAITKFLDFLHDDHEREIVIEGYPGCGKSFLTKHMMEAVKNSNQLIKMLSGQKGNEIEPILTATTNKAAKVLSDFMDAEAITIHSALGLRVKNDYKTGETKLIIPTKNGRKQVNFHKNKLIIIDEASYIDDYLLKIIRECTFDCKIVYIGDRYQLAPIKSSRPPVFYGIDNKATLTTSKRFDENGAIAALGQQMRDTIDSNVWQPIVANGVDIVHATDAEFIELMKGEFTSLQHRSEEARVLAWTNHQVQKYNGWIRGLHTTSDKFAIGEEVVLAANLSLKHGHVNSGGEEFLNLPVETELVISSDPVEFEGSFGDPDFETWELPLYKVTAEGIPADIIMPKHFDHYYKLLKLLAKQAKTQSKHWLHYFRAKDILADLRPSYASTVYKAQGSTYRKVFIDLDDIGKCHSPEQVARMLHVAVTRATDQVIFRGSLPEKYGG